MGNERGGLFSAIKEIKNILERAPRGVLQGDILTKSPRFSRLTWSEQRDVMNKLFCNGVIRQFRLQGDDRIILLHKMFSPPEEINGVRVVPAEQPDNYVRPALPDIADEVVAIKKKIATQIKPAKEEKPMTVAVPAKATKAVLNIPPLSADELRKQAEQLIKAAEVAEQRERNSALRDTIAPIQLQVAKAVAAVQKHVDGLVDATSELEKAAELLRKAMAEAD